MAESASLLADLVAIDSVNPALVPGGAGEQRIARHVAEWLDQAGLDTALDEAAPGRPNAVGVARGTGGGRSLLLVAHTDTVGFSGMERPLEPAIVDGRLHGRGSYDMKAGLAAIMLAGREAVRRSLRGDVIVAAVADEEHASVGAEALVREISADAAVVTEPTGLDVCVAHRGFMWIDVETRGRAAHGSMPQLGIDAIAKMGPVISGLAELDRSLRAEPGHALLGSGSLHCSLIEGGQELSSYPERCLLRVERRTVPGETAEGVEGEVSRLLAAVAGDDADFQGSVQTTFARSAFEVSEEEHIVRVVRSAARGVLGREPAVVGHSAWMDSSILAGAGIPTVVIGPGGHGAHAAVEWVELRDVELLVDLLVAASEDFCG
jgi:acetylornithine deacetylase/succinyl-diaminopimelate desuccinylase-like protein